MNFLQKNIFLSIILLGSWIFIGHNIKYGIPKNIPSTPIKIINTENNSLFNTPKVKETIKLIKKNSYGFSKKTTTDIENNILKSVVNGVGDKYSSYFTQKEAKDFSEMLQWDFEGIWAVINQSAQWEWIEIVRIIPDSPAQKSWLKSWDIMIRANDTDLVWESVENAVVAIRWPKWTKVLIAYLRAWEPKEQQVEVTRDVVNVPSVAHSMLTEKIGYIEVASFWEHTTEEFTKSWNNLISTWAQWLIIDFRNNGWGFLDTAINLASMTLPPDTPIVTIKENDATKNKTLHSFKNITNNTRIPIVVLVNHFSASASEIFAWALKDHRRAVIVWQKTYGKWSVQEPFFLEDGSMVKLTTARWYTPNNNTIDNEGIEPDIVVQLKKKDYEQEFDRQKSAAQNIVESMIWHTGSIQSIIDIYKKHDFSTLSPN